MSLTQTPSEGTPSRAASMCTGGRTLTLCSRGRRRGSRVKTDGEVRYRTGTSGRWLRGRLSELSPQGLALEPVGESLEAGVAIAGFLRLAGAPHEVEFLGEVVRAVLSSAPGGPTRYAVRFLYLPESDRRRLDRAVTRGRRPDRVWVTGSRSRATTLSLWPVAQPGRDGGQGFQP